MNRKARNLTIFGAGLTVALIGSLLSYNLALYGVLSESQAVTGTIASGAIGCVLVIAGVVARYTHS